MDHHAFEKIIGYENVKQELYRILDRLCNPEKYEALGVTASHGLLLHGAPGVGKSVRINPTATLLTTSPKSSMRLGRQAAV